MKSHAVISDDNAGLRGVIRVYSEQFTLNEPGKRLFTITVSPGKGSCKTSIFDSGSGEVVVSKNTAEDITLKVLLKATG